jgi:carbon-monoxide dehydrogenase iron sulfur subunit
MKTVFVRPERCIGCRQCEIACAVEHSQSKDLLRAHFEDPPPRARIHVQAGPSPHTAFPNRCRHCAPAPCLATCPTGAIHRDGEAVLIAGERCITCAMCAIVCPFAALTYHRSRVLDGTRVVALKCDACIDRQRAGRVPACVEVCKTEALEFGEINEIAARERGRYAETVLVSAFPSATPGTEPAHVSAWRAMGESTRRQGVYPAAEQCQGGGS